MNTQHGMTSIAELKEVIGKLWKSVDSFKASSAQEDQRIKDQIGEWTQTNLELLKLLATKTGETERLAQNYSRLSSLNKFDQEWQVLHRQIEQLNAILVTSKRGIQTGISSSEASALQREISKLGEQVRNAIAVYPLTVVTPNQQTSNWDNRWRYRVLVLLMMAIITAGVTTNLQLDHIQKRVEWSLIKLQRVEQRLMISHGAK